MYLLALPIPDPPRALQQIVESVEYHPAIPVDFSYFLPGLVTIHLQQEKPLH
jgi:hypothetical protein